MILDKQVIKFIGFTPSTLMRSFVEEKIVEIQKEATPKCILNVVFTKKDHMLKGVVTLHTSSGIFIAVAHGGRLDIVTIKILKQLRKKIDKWKMPKFHQERFRDITINYNNQTMGAM